MRSRNSLAQAMRWLVVAVAVGSSFFPFYWLFVLATRDPVEALAEPQLFYRPDFSSFALVWGDRDFARSMVMSLSVTFLTVAIALVIATPAAYILVRHRIRHRVGLLGWLLIAYLLPDFLVAIPMYGILQSIGLYDTALGLAMAYQVFMTPLGMWLLLRFFASVPPELAEAATIDGCAELAILNRVYLPLVLPGLATTGIIIGTLAWNEVTIALALTIRNPTLPITVSSYKGYASIAWDQLAAASLLVTVPVFIFALFAQKQIVSGLTAGIGK